MQDDYCYYTRFCYLSCHQKSNKKKRHKFARSETEFVVISHASGSGVPGFWTDRVSGPTPITGACREYKLGIPASPRACCPSRIVLSCLRRRSFNRHPIFSRLTAPRSKARQPRSQSISIISHASQEGRRRCLDEESRCHPRSCIIQRSVIALYLHPTLSRCFAGRLMLVANTY